MLFRPFFISLMSSSYIVHMGYRFLERPVKREIINSTIKIKKSIFAMEAAAATILKNPKIPATTATIKSITDHFNMFIHLNFLYYLLSVG